MCSTVQMYFAESLLQLNFAHHRRVMKVFLTEYFSETDVISTICVSNCMSLCTTY